MHFGRLAVILAPTQVPAAVASAPSAMSTPGGGGASRGITAKPTAPLKGSFPLDHFGECKSLMLAYNKCMRVSLFLPSGVRRCLL